DGIHRACVTQDICCLGLWPGRLLLLSLTFHRITLAQSVMKSIVAASWGLEHRHPCRQRGAAENSPAGMCRRSQQTISGKASCQACGMGLLPRCLRSLMGLV